ncbi:uncharacterized protein DDB_G0271670-like [Trichogramma pretiosum]|uniref:uncharacterized protein DDB_G0271670-like n=1 Tax=Trichogramma pretiosum TaxID=7493 RepID=UPI0006C984B4|nr:uncharacterized protein DDB_G0271670-like [Trichogramma pretiosum]
MFRIFVSAALLLGWSLWAVNGQNCAEDRIRKCIAVAEPMLKDPHLIFPDNMNDINNVCRTWSNFVDCIKRYIDKCFSKVRKDQFNSAVEPPINSVHQMCSKSSYQAEYLQYASCIKATVIEPEHCGSHYSFLVSEVSRESVRKPNLCCAYHNFRSCVILKTRMRCDGNKVEGVAARFSRQVLDKAFHFLQDQCASHIPDTGKCSSMIPHGMRSWVSTTAKAATAASGRLGEARSVTATRGQSRQQQQDVYRAKASDFYDSVTSGAVQSSAREVHASTMPHATMYPYKSYGPSKARSTTSLEPQSSVTTTPRQASSTASRSVVWPSGADRRDPDASSSKQRDNDLRYSSLAENSMSGASSTVRSPGFARGISWSSAAPTTSKTTSTTSTTTTTTPTSRSVLMASTSEIPDWATNTWFTLRYDPTTEEVYPAAGSFGGNNIDEPNQQGLSRKSHAGRVSAAAHCILLVLPLTCIQLY